MDSLSELVKDTVILYQGNNSCQSQINNGTDLTYEIEGIEDAQLCARRYFFAKYIRDKVKHRYNGNEAFIIFMYKHDTITANRADPLMDARMYEQEKRKDPTTYIELYGMPYQQVLALSESFRSRSC